MGPHEPYWRTNTSFSPPPPRWDFRFHSDAQSFNSQEGSRLYASSTSSNSRTNYLPNHRHSNSDEIGAFFSTPSDLSPTQQWTPPAIQEINLHEYANSSTRVPTSEGLSVPNENRVSISSNSDSSDYETLSKSLTSHHSFTSRGCFMSKPVHPVPIPVRNSPGIHDSDASCDLEFSDVSEPIESDSVNKSSGDNNNYKCGLCERFLSQRSPWSTRRIIRSGDFPVTGVLSCRHVFHAECLDQTTPKTQKGDPSCPVCSKSEANNKNSPEQCVLLKLKNGVPRNFEGALSAPSCNAMLLVNQNRVKKGVLLKENSGKEFAGKVKGGGGGGGGVGSSKSASNSRNKL